MDPNEHLIEAEGEKINKEDQEILFSKICHYLKQNNVEFEVLEHEETRTSQESAMIRNTPLEWGSKTMLVVGKEGLYLLIYRANLKVSWKKVRKVNEVGKKGQMATEDEVMKLGVKPGGVPPFPHILGIKGILDSRFKNTEKMAFNAGHKSKSIVMRTDQFPMEDLQIEDITEE